MILPQLLWRFAKHRDDAEFYRLQAVDAIRWLRAEGIALGPQTTVLDLGCGHGIFGGELSRLGCKVTFADESNFLWPPQDKERFLPVDLDRDSLGGLGKYDVVVCSNVLEHLSKPDRFCNEANQLLRPGGVLYLSWTNWLSPWGGHEFSPLHYLGTRLGPAIYDQIAKRPRFHHPYRNLFPTYIGTVLKWLRTNDAFSVMSIAPRYYTELAFIMRVPWVREFAAWNCAILLRGRH